MKVKLIPALKRFVEGNADGATRGSQHAHTRLRGKDFMAQDLTGSARRFSL